MSRRLSRVKASESLITITGTPAKVSLAFLIPRSVPGTCNGFVTCTFSSSFIVSSSTMWLAEKYFPAATTRTKIPSSGCASLMNPSFSKIAFASLKATSSEFQVLSILSSLPSARVNVQINCFFPSSSMPSKYSEQISSSPSYSENFSLLDPELRTKKTFVLFVI